jgi:hypothetical protein
VSASQCCCLPRQIGRCNAEMAAAQRRQLRLGQKRRLSSWCIVDIVGRGMWHGMRHGKYSLHMELDVKFVIFLILFRP